MGGVKHLTFISGYVVWTCTLSFDICRWYHWSVVIFCFRLFSYISFAFECSLIWLKSLKLDTLQTKILERRIAKSRLWSISLGIRNLGCESTGLGSQAHQELVLPSPNPYMLRVWLGQLSPTQLSLSTTQVIVGGKKITKRDFDCSGSVRPRIFPCRFDI